MVPFPHGKKARDISKIMSMREEFKKPQGGKTGKRFYPDYLSEVIFSMLVAFQVLMILSLLYPPVAGRQIDFSRPFQPVPEWYFLWLFELLAYFPGDFAFVGTVLMPLIFVLLLFSIPFIDRGQHGRFKAVIAGTIILAGFIILTLLSII